MRYLFTNLKTTILKTFAFFLTATLLMGCVAERELEPAAGANVLPANPDAAVDIVSGVRVVAEANAWTGMEEIKQEVTPMKITIENNSDKEIRFQVSDFSLVSPITNAHYGGLPLHQIEGTVEDPILVEGYTTVPNPTFYSTGFHVAPYLTDVYVGYTPYSAGMYYYDPYYYNSYYQYWSDRNIPIPTGEMYRKGLPDGVIQPDGKIEGYVFFERVPAAEEIVNLNTRLINAETGDIVGSVSIPFEMETEEVPTDL